MRSREIMPRLVAAQHQRDPMPGAMSSGVAGLDELLGGGLERGSSMLVTGAPGTGKSTIAAAFAVAAARRGELAALFLFDEAPATLLKRMAGLGHELEPHIASGLLTVHRIDPSELSPGEFATRVAGIVRDEHATVVVIDSLNGYLNAMPDERFLQAQLHEMLTYLGAMGTTTLLVGVQMGLIGQMSSPVDASYLADTVMILRYFEAEGEVRQAVSVLKKRSGAHERTIREFRIDEGGLHVGQPLRDFHGVLTGVPMYAGSPEPLMKGRPR